jgi:hypothetical protein
MCNASEPVIEVNAQHSSEPLVEVNAQHSSEPAAETRYDKLYKMLIKYSTKWSYDYFAGYNSNGLNATETPKPASILFENDIESGVQNVSLWLGSAQHAKSEILSEIGVKFVMNVAAHDTGSCSYGDGIEFEEHRCIEGDETFSMLPFIRRGVELYRQCMDSGKPLFVHCLMGINRSSSVIVGIIMAIKRIPLEDAIAYVREHRRYASPSYIRELLEFERELGITA